MDQYQRTEAIHMLDVKYRGAMHQTDLIVKDEEARRLKLRVIVLRDEVAVLHDQLAEKDDRISTLSQQYEDICAQLGQMKQTCQDQAEQLRLQARQQSDLKTELQSLNNMSDDSTKTLAEKLALSRELAVLKPEIDHLRSQVSHQKDVLAEKLALERKLSSLETELANEKRAAEQVIQRQENEDNQASEELQQRVADLEKKLAAEKKASQKAKKAQEKGQTDAEEELRQQVADLEKRLAAEQKASETARKTNQKAQSDTEAELRQQVAGLEKKLADEKRAAQKAKRSQDSDEKESQSELQLKVQELEEKLVSEAREAERARRASEKEAATANDQVEMLTQRVEEFKNKLKETRAELKEVRAELTEARSAPARTTTTTTVPLKDNEAKRPLSKSKAAKKRGANEISVDEMMMDTPGHVEGRNKRPLKKRGVDFTTVGEKSTFSITPFLEKSNTINLAETIEEEDEEPSILIGKGDPGAPIIEPEAETTDDIPLATVEKPAKSVAKALKATKSKATDTTQKKARGRPKAQALKESSPNTNVPSATNARASPRSKSASLEKVVEEPEEPARTENVPSGTIPGSKKSGELKDNSASNSTAPSAVDTGNAGSENPEPKKKKRKLLGTSNKGTLFDKDEDAGETEAMAPPKTAAAAGGGKRKPVGLKASKGPVSSLAKNAFGGKAFSPLKRDRRGVNASFLA